MGDSLTNPQRNNITREDQTSKKVGTQIIAQSVGEEEQEGEMEGRGGEKEKKRTPYLEQANLSKMIS